MVMVKIVSTFSPVHFRDDLECIAIGISLEELKWSSEEDLAGGLRNADIVVTRQAIPLSEKVISGLDRCRLIHNIGTGHSGIDVEAATRMGIPVSYPGDFCVREVGEHTIALALACARKVVRLDAAARRGAWSGYGNPDIIAVRRPMFRIAGSVFAIVGLGRIGRTAAKLAQGLGFRVVACSPSVPDDVFAELGIERLDLGDLLAIADIVALTGAARRDRPPLLGRAEFEAMKPTAYLVNCAHGSLVDQAALQAALSEGAIAGAALDVLALERLRPDDPLVSLDNVIFTASSAGYSEISYDAMKQRLWSAIRAVLDGRRPEFLINPDVVTRPPETSMDR